MYIIMIIIMLQELNFNVQVIVLFTVCGKKYAGTNFYYLTYSVIQYTI